jgi:hypothetical protein
MAGFWALRRFLNLDGLCHHQASTVHFLGSKKMIASSGAPQI